MKNPIQNQISELQNVLSAFNQEHTVSDIINRIIGCIENEGTIFVCGNGGSAADAQHFSAELVGRYNKERRGFRSVCLNADTSALTAIGNDYGYDQVFKRQLKFLGKKSDVFIGISSSGNSRNVIEASKCAREMSIVSIGLLGKGGGAQKEYCDIALVIDSQTTARVQEMHGFLIHAICEALDEKYAI